MSDRFPAKITIGGELKKSYWNHFIEALHDDNPCVGERYDESPAIDLIKEPNDLEKHLTDGFLVLTDSDAPYGEFTELERACQELDLDYDRHCDACYEYNGEIFMIRSGFEEKRMFSTQDEKPLVSVEEMKSVLGENFELIEELTADEIKNWLKNFCGDNVPPMRKLKIVD